MLKHCPARGPWLCCVIFLLACSTQLFADPAAPPTSGAVEVREGDVWSKATIVKAEGRRTQVKYEDGTTEWVTPDRLRGASGSGSAGNPTINPPPAESKLVTLDSGGTPVSLDNVQTYKKATGASVAVTPTTKPAANFTAFTPAESAIGVGKLSKLMITGGTPWIVSAIGQGDGEQSQLALINTATGGPFDVRSLPFSHRSILGVADGGRIVFSKPSKNDDATIYTWEWDGGAYVLKGNAVLVAKGGKVRMEYAVAVSATRLAVGVNNDMMFLIDVGTKRAVGAFKNEGGGAELHGSGKIILCNGVLLRASDLQVMTEFKDARRHLVGVDPTGTVAGFDSGGVLNVVKLPAATPIATLPGVLGEPGPIRLLNANTLMLARKHLVYDVKTAVPLWQYAVPGDDQWIPCSNGQSLFAFSNGDMTSFAMADLPDPNAAGAMKTAKDENYDLLPGVSIQILGDVKSIYGDQGVQAQKNLEKCITSAGDKVTDNSPHYQLTVTSAPGKSHTGNFEIHRGPMGDGRFSVDAPTTIVTLTLTFDGKPLWTHVNTYTMGPILMMQNGQTPQDAANAAARPSAASLASVSLPKYIVKGSTAERPATLGSSTILPDGFDAAPADSSK